MLNIWPIVTSDIEYEYSIIWTERIL